MTLKKMCTITKIFMGTYERAAIQKQYQMGMRKAAKSHVLFPVFFRT